MSWLGTTQGTVMVGYPSRPLSRTCVLFTTGLRGVPPATANTLGLAEPLVATLFGVALLHERLALRGWIGVGLMLAGLVLLGRQTAGRTEQSTA